MIRNILKKILSEEVFGKIERESRRWLIVCKCGYITSYWDTGGVRAGTISRKKKIWGRCPQCKKFRMFDVIKSVKF